MAEESVMIPNIDLGSIQTLAYQNRFEEAQQRLSLALRQYPNNPDILLGQAFLLLMQSTKQPDQNIARAYLRQAKSIFENLLLLAQPPHQTHLLLGQLYQRLNEKNKAIEHYRRYSQLAPNSLVAYETLGNSLKENKQFDEARQVFQQAVQVIRQANPQIERNFASINPELSQNYLTMLKQLGYCAYQAGHDQLSLSSYKTFLGLSPDNIDIRYNLALIYMKLEDWETYQQEIKILEQMKNGQAFAASCWSMLAEKQGKPRISYGWLAKACRLDPKFDEAYRNRIIILKNQSKHRLAYCAWARYEQKFGPLDLAQYTEMINMASLAMAHIQARNASLRAIEHFPKSLKFWNSLINLEVSFFLPNIVEDSLEKMRAEFGNNHPYTEYLVIRAKVGHNRTHKKDLAADLHLFRQQYFAHLKQAEQRQFSQLENDYYTDRAALSFSNDDIRAAICNSDDMLDREPHLSEFLYQRLTCYNKLEKLPKSAALYDLLRLKNPRDPLLFIGTCHVWGMLNVPGAASRSAQRAVEIAPNDANAHRNLAIMLLHSGNYRRGFQELDWRWKLFRDGNAKTIDFRNRIPSPPARTLEQVKGKGVLLYGEQGAGDVINFVRFVPELAKYTSNIRVAMDPLGYGNFNRLLKKFPGITTLNEGLVIPRDFHFQASLWDLPMILGTDKFHIPPPTRFYLDDELRLKWQIIINELHPTSATNGILSQLPLPPSRQLGRPLRVGFVFSGGTENPANRRRSLQLDGFEVILRAFPLIHFVCLHIDFPAGTKERLQLYPNVSLINQHIKDFADTAAAIEQLDMVVTVDTSVAHLAATQGKETWIMTSWRNDWRWGVREHKSWWYPSVSLFHQHRLGDWSGMLQQVIRRLANVQHQHLPQSSL